VQPSANRLNLPPAALAAGLLLAVPQLAASQTPAPGVASREVVQPLPSPAVERLNRALMDLARRPKSLDSLLEAADASLAVNDYDAAVGFYGRAANIAPGDPRVKLGTARVYLLSGRPVAALPMFAAAQSAGAAAAEVLIDRGLALDMVGQQDEAQEAYARVLELQPANAEARRRLALSQAISGDADAFAETLSPLLEARDFAAFRVRAFGLAILGEAERAAAIADAVMPPDLAGRISPFLAFMPRLTSAQQAAAANLGFFPSAAEMGRRDPRIERFTREEALDRRLEPAGEPLDAPRETISREVAQPVAQTRSTKDAPAPVEQRASLPSVETREVGRDATGAIRVSDAFADLDAVGPPRPQASGDAVDIAAIEAPREPAPSTVAEHPRRVWVQVATGQDLSALAFDWRRLSRRVPGLLSEFEPHTIPWGQANRLLAGPLASESEARKLINALAARGIDTFPYTSPEGTEIHQLD